MVRLCYPKTLPNFFTVEYDLVDINLIVISHEGVPGQDGIILDKNPLVLCRIQGTDLKFSQR
jgi:hypothetical protein